MAKRKAGGSLSQIREALEAPPQPTRARLAAEGRQGFSPIISRKEIRSRKLARPALDPRFAKNYRRRIQEEDEAGFQWIIPTHTSNPLRPRTLQAGYNPRLQELRVVFRDGTPWVYQGVEPLIWRQFISAPSPGQFINAVLNRYPYQRGDFER